MGQARQRGTFEERKARAIERDNAEREKRKAAKVEREKRIANDLPKRNQVRTRRILGASSLVFAALAAIESGACLAEKPATSSEG